MVPGIVILWAVAVLALFLTARRWVAAPIAAGYATLLFLAVELGLLYLNPLLGLPLPVLDLVVWGAVVVGAGVWLVTRRPARPSSRWWVVLAAASGSIVVVATMALAQVIPGAARLSWAMNSDSVNVMTFSRDILAAGGLASASTSADTSPTPLPFGMLATVIAPGRDGIANAALAEHDVVGLAQLWVFMIALACLLAGLVAAHGAAKVRLALAIPVTAIASLAMLSWYVIGVQFAHGFLSSAFAVVVLLAAWLVYLDGATRPAISLAMLLLAGTAVLAIWSPLIIVIAALGVVIAVTRFRQILASGALRLVAVGAGFVVLALYVALVTLPEYLVKAGFLGASGGFPAFSAAQFLLIMLVTALVAAVGARFLGLRHPVIGAIAAVIGGAIGLGFLLAQRTSAESGLGYYPAKFAWTVTILLIVIAIGGAAGLLVGLNPKRGWDVAIAILSVGVLGGLLWSPVQPTAQFPPLGVLTGATGGMPERAADLIFETSGRDNGQDVFWRTTIGDSWPNLWALQLDIDDVHHNPVRNFAYQVTTFTPDEMCEVVELLGSDVVIHTADPAAEADLAAVCDGDDRVELGAY
jgi:hypothetical protein